jgi:hypothetical protein
VNFHPLKTGIFRIQDRCSVSQIPGRVNPQGLRKNGIPEIALLITIPPALHAPVILPV